MANVGKKQTIASKKLHLQMVLRIILMLRVVICIGSRQVNNRDGNQILFPGTKKNENREIPLDLIRRLNMISSVEEFFDNMVDYKDSDLTDRMGISSFEKGLLKSERIGKCMPEYRTIYLQPNETATTFYYPRCIRVKRCGGCCLHDLFSCKPIVTEVIPVVIAVAEYRGGHQFRLKERKVFEIEQHTKCECGCKIRPQDCTKYQRYNAESCRCECPNSEDEKRCFNKIWNPDFCSCICRDELTCGSGFEFDPFGCSCVPARNRKKSGFTYRIYM